MEMANAEGEENMVPVSFQPEEDPTFIKRCRTTAKANHTRSTTKLRSLVESGIPSFQYAPDIQKLEEDFVTALRVNTAFIASLRHHNCDAKFIQAAEEWGIGLESNHRLFKEEMAAAEERRRTTDAETIASTAAQFISAPITAAPHHTFSPRMTRFVNRFSSPSQHRPPAGARGFTSFPVTEPILSQDLNSLFSQAQSIPLTEPEAAPLTSQQPSTVPMSFNTPLVTSGIHQPASFSTSDGSNQTGFNWAASGAVPRHYQSQPTSFGPVPQSSSSAHLQMNPPSSFQNGVQSSPSAYDLAVHCAQQYNPPQHIGSTPFSSVGTSVPISSFATGYVPASTQIIEHPSTSSTTGIYGAGYIPVSTHTVGYPLTSSTTGIYRAGYNPAFTQGTWHHRLSTSGQPVSNVFVHSSAPYPSSSLGFVHSIPASVPHYASAAHGIQQHPSASTFLQTSSAASATQMGYDPFVPASMSHAHHNIRPMTGTPSLSSSIQQQLHLFHQPPATSFHNPYPSFGTATSGSLNINVEVFNGDPLQFPMFMSCFKTLIHDVLPNDAMRLAALTNHLSPEVRNTISDALHDPALYNLAIARLYEEYGHDIVVSEAHVDKLLALPLVRSDDPAGLKKFSNELHGAVSALIHSKHVHELNSTGTLKLLLQKLPNGIRTKWGQAVFDIQPVIPNIADFDDWLRRIVKSQSFASSIGAMNLLPTKPASNEKKAASAAPTDKKPNPSPVKKKSFPSTVNMINVEEEIVDPPMTTEKDSDSSSNYRCFVCSVSPPHRIEQCSKFLNLSPTQRAELVVKENRCLRCIIGRHFVRKCNSKIKCQEEDCGRSHHTLLHGADRINQKKQDSDQSSSSVPKSMNALQHESFLEDETLLQIVPATVRSLDGQQEDALLFLDNGSKATLIMQDLADQLKLPGETRLVPFKVFNGGICNIESRRVDFDLVSCDGSFIIPVRGAYTSPTIDIAQRRYDWPRIKLEFPHLADLNIRSCDPAKVKILVGSDVIRAHQQFDVRYPEKDGDGPAAYLTPFGWCPVGPVTSAGLQPPNHRHINHIQPVDQDLLQSVERFWITDTLVSKAPPESLYSQDDRRALDIFKSSARYVDGKIEIGLPWKEEIPSLDDNREEVLRRFNSLERRFRKDPDYAARYAAMVNDYIRLGHARLTTKEELENSPPWTFYLAHHGVTYPHKPDKIRVVFDLSSPPGKSLNSKLLKGPDFLTGLLGVLLRFRANPYALISDIEKMFHQVRVRPEEQAALRFFWRNPGDRSPPLVHQMTVHVFGGVSSPSVCAYALRKTAEDNRSEFPDVADVIIRNFYVDNFLGSTNTEEEAISVAQRLTEMLQRGGFRLTKWVSSSRTVMASIPEEERADPTLDLSKDQLPIERTLGVLYSSEDDCFFFRPSLDSGARRVRKTQNQASKVDKSAGSHRSILSAVSTIYDPLGFLSPVVITAKCLLQDICRLRLGWDQRLPDILLDRWDDWRAGLDVLKDLRIPRCLRRVDVAPIETTLHIFSDASERAYGAVAFLRSVYPDGDVRVSLFMSKTRVAPLKQLSIPQLELQGAILGLHLAETISFEMELELHIEDVTFWVDSLTVLKWINSNNRFKAFVAHRIGEILSKTARNQWRHVPGSLNPADHCSRGLRPHELTSDHHFIAGPEYLLLPSSEWPADVIIHETDITDPEVAKNQINQISVSEVNVINILIERITWLPVSRLSRLEKIVGWMKRFIFNCRARRFNQQKKSGALSIDELDEALSTCIRIVQETYFFSELKQLQKNRPVHRTSSLLKLSPFIDKNGLIRVGGRLDRSIVAPDVKHPIILPSSHRFTGLIIWHYHLQGQLRGSHVRSERLLSDLRSIYWIIGGRKTIQRELRHCFTCQRLYAKAVAPQMAPLPVHRLGPLTFPFVNTGLDYFGPLYVAVGRQSHKRWVCIFTCLVTRAVHMETTGSMDTEAFLMCFQRFVDIRGCPSVIVSDNGTNLVGGKRQLDEGADQLDLNAVIGAFTARRIKWKFSPPLSPHFGGVFERMVRSAKTALRAVLGSRTVTDEILRTVIGGAAAMINSRPLTHISYDPDDPEPLTPNHFLLGRSQPHLPMSHVDERDVLSRRHFVASQALLDSFWRRWREEYMPKLNERKKWFQNHPPLKKDDFVLIVDENTPRGQWPIGKIEKIEPGQDKIVRVVHVTTKDGTYTRSVHRLIPLNRPDASVVLDPIIPASAGTLVKDDTFAPAPLLQQDLSSAPAPIGDKSLLLKGHDDQQDDSAGSRRSKRIAARNAARQALPTISEDN